MADKAKKLYADFKEVGMIPERSEIKIVDSDELQSLGMNLFYGVGRGADCPPCCVVIKYMGNPDSDEVDFGVVGKGITYDTGGLNIKMALMELMYGDKGGACAVLGAAKGTMIQQLKKNIVFCCAFAENAIGAGCYKPSDILTSMHGWTVEIGNTDAEGRLVMADAMTYV